MYLFIVIHCVLALITTKCNGLYERSCNVLPQNYHVEEGSDIEVSCQSSCVSGKVFWTLNNRRVIDSVSRRVNSTHTVLLLPYSLLQEPSNPISTVQCHSEASQQILGGTTVRIYSKPHNISCILHSNRELKEGLPRLLTCNWEHHINPPLKVSYSVICSQCGSGQKEICTSVVTSCNINVLNTSISFVKKNTIYVRAKTEFWEAHSADYTFNASQIFKIPSRRVNVTATSGHVLVEWDSLPNLGVNGVCQVRYQYMKDEESIEVVLNKTQFPNEEGRITISEVESCRTYSVSVRCALDQAPWSYWSPERTVLTKLKNNDVHLDVWRKVSKLQGRLNVHVMWKGIPSNCPGTLHYSISPAPYKGQSSPANYTGSLCANSSCHFILNQEAHRMKLTVFYNGGFLAEDSFHLSAFAEDESDSLFRVKNIETKHELNGLVVRWAAPSQPVSGYVIDWTRDGDEFDWKRTEFTNITLQGLADKEPYNITVTPLLGNETGQATQISGICSSFTNPGSVTIDSLEAYDKSAHVSWSIKPQENCSDAVVNYTVIYWTSNGARFNVSVKNSVRDVYLKDLNPNTHYSVHVVATAGAGTSVSSEEQFKTRLYDPQLISILSVTGSIVIIFCLGLCCAFRKFYDSPLPDPGLSSLSLWAQTTHQKTLMPFGPFNTPSESLCDRVYTEEMHQTSIITNFQTSVFSDKRNQTTSLPQNHERPLLSTNTPHQCSARNSIQNSDNYQFNPYRSQTADDSPAPRSSKQNKRLGVRLQEKTPSYVSLDMFDS